MCGNVIRVARYETCPNNRQRSDISAHQRYTPPQRPLLLSMKKSQVAKYFS